MKCYDGTHLSGRLVARRRVVPRSQQQHGVSPVGSHPLLWAVEVGQIPQLHVQERFTPSLRPHPSHPPPQPARIYPPRRWSPARREAGDGRHNRVFRPWRLRTRAAAHHLTRQPARGATDSGKIREVSWEPVGWGGFVAAAVDGCSGGQGVVFNSSSLGGGAREEDHTTQAVMVERRRYRAGCASAYG